MRIDEFIGMATSTATPISKKLNLLQLRWYTLNIFLTLICLVHCVPIEVVYTGDSCDCQTKLDYSINVPKVSRQHSKYTRTDYGYKLDVPVQAKAKVTYTFDFVVEEPKTPKPSFTSNKKWNLYAKVDRVAVNKPDCESQSSSSLACKCLGSVSPGYGYVYNRVPTRSNYVSKCKSKNIYKFRADLIPNAIPNSLSNKNFVSNLSPKSKPDLFSSLYLILSPNLYSNLDRNTNTNLYNNLNGISIGNGNLVSNDGEQRRRLKRDLYHNYFRPRQTADANERSGRLIKLYSKSIKSPSSTGIIDNFFTFDTRMMEPLNKNLNTKRKLKKAYFPRLVKRDIKGEYDLLEKDRQQIDLTLPEIIQFMPEVLQPSFKKQSCIFDSDSKCSKTMNMNRKHFENTRILREKDFKLNTKDDYEVNTRKVKEPYSQVYNQLTTQINIEPDARVENQFNKKFKKLFVTPKLPSTSTATTTFNKKRNVPANYDYIESKEKIIMEPPSPLPPKTSKKVIEFNIPAKQLSQTPQTLQPSPYILDGDVTVDPTISIVGPCNVDSSDISYVNSDVGSSICSGLPDDQLKLLMPKAQQALPTTPLPYNHHKQPLYHISNEELDKIVSDIIYRHPDYIDATSHGLGSDGYGTLVDPEPLQEQQIREFLKKLIDGRLSLWFKEEETHTPPSPLYYLSSYETPLSPDTSRYRTKSS